MDFPPYPSGLRLAGRRVLVVGGGNVAQRRVPQLIAVGADVHLVSPEVTPAIEGLVGSGEITWHQRRFEDSDLDGAWYVIAATNDPYANALVSEAAEERPEIAQYWSAPVACSTDGVNPRSVSACFARSNTGPGTQPR